MKINIFFKTIILAATLCLCATGGYANGSGKENPPVKCKAGVFPSLLLAIFPVSDPSQKTWVWNKNWDHHVDKNTYQMGFDYSWIVEPGNMKNGIFEASKYAFGQAHWNTYYLDKGESSGTVAGLISEIGTDPSYVYLNDPDPDKRREENEKIGDLPVYVAHHDDDIVLYSNSLGALEILFSDHPEYARMTMKTPYPSQSYVCMAKIYYKK